MYKDEKGLMLLPMVLAIMILASTVVAAQLAFSTSTLKSSNALSAPVSMEGCEGDIGVVDESYSTNAGVEHAMWRILYEDGFGALFSPESPTVSYEMTINDCPVPVTITQIFPEGYVEGEGTTPAQEIRVEKTVNNPSFPSAGNRTVTYQITVEAKGEGYCVGLVNYCVRCVGSYKSARRAVRITR